MWLVSVTIVLISWFRHNVQSGLGCVSGQNTLFRWFSHILGVAEFESLCYLCIGYAGGFPKVI